MLKRSTQWFGPPCPLRTPSGYYGDLRREAGRQHFDYAPWPSPPGQAVQAAGPATSRGGFREAPLWGQPPSAASATGVAEDNSFPLSRYFWQNAPARERRRDIVPEGEAPLA